MENTVKLENWEDYKNTINFLYKDSSVEGGSSSSELLFRGQSDCDWELKTTLDRCREEPFSFAEYFQLALSVKPEIETFTENTWDVPEFSELSTYSKLYNNIWQEFPAYEYLAYLRHHGFPSPLLDWSASPYVAAFFASSNKTGAENIAIYCFQELTDAWKTTSNEKPQIKSFGPRVKSHKRHFLQQSRYTICAKYEDEHWSYRPHNEVFSLKEQNQDLLTKYVLPASERNKIMVDLDRYNINAFSLLQNEEALLDTLAFRQLLD